MTFRDKHTLTRKDVYKKMNKNITNVFIENVAIIGNYAFRFSMELKSISFPSSLESIGENAFYNCVNLENISFKEKSKLKTIRKSAFQHCRKLKSISFPSSVTHTHTQSYMK